MYQAVTRAVNLLFRGRESASDDSPSPDESDQSFSRQVRQRVDSPASDIFDIEKALTSNGVGSQGVRLTHGNYVYNLTRLKVEDQLVAFGCDKVVEVKCSECKAIGKFILPAGAVVSRLGHSPRLQFKQPVSHEQGCLPSFIKIVSEKAKDQIMLRYLQGLSKVATTATFRQCYEACKAKVCVCILSITLINAHISIAISPTIDDNSRR